MGLLAWQLCGAAFTAAAGTLLHFCYGWADRSPAMAPFCTVNESVWEHLKLLATPMLLFAVAEFFCYGRSMPGFVPVRVCSVFYGMATVVALYYIYSGILGRHFLLADILLFLIGVCEAYLLGFVLLARGALAGTTAVFGGYLGLLLLVFCQFLFTFRPPRLGLFRDPVTGGYGVEG